MLLNLIKKSFIGIGTNDPYTKLANDIERKVVKTAAFTAIDLASALATPFITVKVADNIVDEYGKKALKVAGAIIFGYQTSRVINGIKMTRSTLDAYAAATEMMGTDAFVDNYPENQPNAVIDLPQAAWEVKTETYDRPMGVDIDVCEDSEDIYEDEEDNSSFDEYIVHIGDPIEEEYVDYSLLQH